MNELFDKYPEMDAMFSEDLIIMNALKCAGERGMHIPDEFKKVELNISNIEVWERK